MDSIRENRTKEDIIEEIRLEMSEDIDDEKCFVLVEGSDDVTFFEKMLANNVVCVESFAGKHGLEELAAEEELKFSNIIFVRDRDYMDITSLQDRMFLYDYCALELMLLSCSEISNSIYSIYYIGHKEKNEFLLHAMRELAPFSILRKKNEKEGLGIAFKDKGIGDQISDDMFNAEVIFNRFNRSTEEYQVCMENAANLENNELWNITNGHDICVYLGAMMKSGKKNFSEVDVKNILFAMYRKDDFKNTNLYASIKEYEEIYNLNFLE